jgi:hypothetical protein
MVVLWIERPPMLIDFLMRVHVCVIIAIGTCLFLAVHELDRRLAVVLQCAIIATGGGAIVNRLLYS